MASDPLIEAVMAQRRARRRAVSPLRKQLTFSELPQMMETAQEGADIAEPVLEDIPDVARQLRERNLTTELAKLKGNISTLKAAAAAPRIVGKIAPDLMAEPNRMLERGRTGIERAVELMDYPSRKLREATTGEGDPEAFTEAVREKAAHGSLPAQLYQGAIGGVGDVLGSGIGAVVGGAQALSDVVTGQEPSMARFKETVKKGGHIGEDTAMIVAADPLLPFTAGLKGGSKVLGSQFGRMAGKAAAQEAESLAPKILGRFNQGELLKQLAERHNISPELYNKVLGEMGELGGKAGPAVFGIDLKVPGQEQLIRKSAGKLREHGLNLAAKVSGSEKVAEYVEKFKRPQYQRQAINQKINELRHGYNTATNEAKAKLADYLGKENVTTDKPMLEGLNKFISQGEKNVAKRKYIGWVRENLGAEADTVMPEMERYFDSGFKGLESGPLSPLMSYFKGQNLMARPGYHVNNMISDSLLMMGNGFKNPQSAVDAVKVLKPGSKVKVAGYTADELKAYGQKAGFASLGAADVPQVHGVKDFEKQVRVAAGKARLGDKVGLGDVMSLGMKRPGEWLARKWDEHSKMAFFIDRLKKGDSPENALKKVNEVLFDYSDPGQFPKFLNFLRTIDPMIGWTYRAATAVPRTILRNPKAATIPLHISQGISSGADYKDIPPEYVRSQGLNAPLPKPAREAVFGLSKAVTGEEPRPGLGLNWRMREPVFEGLAPLTEGKTGGVSPLLGAGYELLSEKDLLTGQDLPRSKAPFPQGSTGMASLEAPAGSNAWFARYFPSLLMAPQTRWLINEWNRRQGRTQLLDRPAAYSEDAALKSFLRLLSIVSGQTLTPTTPGANIREAAYNDEVQKAAKTKMELRGLLKR